MDGTSVFNDPRHSRLFVELRTGEHDWTVDKWAPSAKVYKDRWDITLLHPFAWMPNESLYCTFI